LRVKVRDRNGECNDCEQSSDPHVRNVSRAVHCERCSAAERSRSAMKRCHMQAIGVVGVYGLVTLSVSDSMPQFSFLIGAG